MIIIGLTGTLGAGKGTIVDYLVNERKFKHFSVRSYLLKRIKSLNLPADRNSMVQVANELRENNSPSYIVDQLYEEAKIVGVNAVIESIRTPGEISSLRKKGVFYLFAVDADPKKRYERVKIRQSETDHVDYSTFIENEEREMTSTDPNKQNLRECIKQADHLVTNNGSIEELLQQLDIIISEIENHPDS